MNATLPIELVDCTIDEVLDALRDPETNTVRIRIEVGETELEGGEHEREAIWFAKDLRAGLTPEGWNSFAPQLTSRISSAPRNSPRLSVWMMPRMSVTACVRSDALASTRRFAVRCTMTCRSVPDGSVARRTTGSPSGGGGRSMPPRDGEGGGKYEAARIAARCRAMDRTRRSDPRASQARTMVEDALADATVRPRPRRWMKGVTVRPGTTYAYSPRYPSTCLVVAGGLVRTVITRTCADRRTAGGGRHHVAIAFSDAA